MPRPLYQLCWLPVCHFLVGWKRGRAKPRSCSPCTIPPLRKTLPRTTDPQWLPPTAHPSHPQGAPQARKRPREKDSFFVPSLPPLFLATQVYTRDSSPLFTSDRKVGGGDAPFQHSVAPPPSVPHKPSFFPRLHRHKGHRNLSGWRLPGLELNFKKGGGGGVGVGWRGGNGTKSFPLFLSSSIDLPPFFLDVFIGSEENGMKRQKIREFEREDAEAFPDGAHS